MKVWIKQIFTILITLLLLAVIKEVSWEINLPSPVRPVFAGHLHAAGQLGDGESGFFCEGDGVTRSQENGNGDHSILENCADQGKICRNGECTKDVSSCNVEQTYQECGGNTECSSKQGHLYKVTQYNSDSCGEHGRYTCTDLGSNSQCGGDTTSGGSCDIGSSNTKLSNSCVDWLSHRGDKNGHNYCDSGTCLVDSIKQLDSKFASCNNEKILEYWCDNISPEDCARKKQEGGAACGGSDSNSCQDNPSGSNPPSGYVWKALQCGQSCDRNDQCPKNSSDPQNVNPETSNWCFNHQCLQLQSTTSGGNCQAEKQSPSLSSACVSCIKSKHSDLVPSIKDQNPSLFNSCNDTQALNYWCNGGIQGAQSDCSTKKNECSSACNASSSNQPNTNSGSGSTGGGNTGGGGGGGGSSGGGAGNSACSEGEWQTRSCASTCGKASQICPKDGKTREVDSSSCSKTQNPSCSGGNTNPTPTPQEETFTSEYRYAESLVDLNKALWLPYPEDPTVLHYTFKDTKPGIKTIFVQFKNNKAQESEKFSTQIELVAGSPTISSLSCTRSLSGDGLKVTFKGSNFGKLTKNPLESGEITSDDLDGDFKIISWADDQVVTTVNSSALVNSSENQFSDGQSYSLKLTRKDGLSAVGACKVNSLSDVSLGAKLFCRSSFEADILNVEAVIADTTDGQVKKERGLMIDKNGVLQGLVTKFEKGKEYVVSIKAPHSLRRVSKPFIPTDGTLQLIFRDNSSDDGNTNVLPIGDIAPLGNEDGKIDNRDKFELIHEFGTVGENIKKPADFNLDGQVNSLDWACMRYDFPKGGEGAKVDDPEPTAKK